MPKRKARRRRLGGIALTIIGVGVFVCLVLGLLFSPAVSVRSAEVLAHPADHNLRFTAEILLGLLAAVVLVVPARAAIRRARG
jgi:hypothetical protein